MRHRLSWTLAPIIGVLAVFASRAAGAPALVELFTSEGCSSCPPADEYLHELAKSQAARAGEIVLIAWHVDYWDHLGWKDPFGLAAASERQRGYAETMKQRGVDRAGVYTPQMIVNGRRAFPGIDRGAGRRAVARGQGDGTRELDLAVSVEGGAVRVTTRLPDLPEGTTVTAVLVEDGLRSSVKSGENSGRTLTHERVARAMAAATVADGQAVATLTPPEGLAPENASVVVFSQAEGFGDVLAVGSAQVPHTSVNHDRFQTVDVGGHEIRYALVLPDGFDPGKTYPAILALPPGAQNEAMVEAGLQLYWEREAKKRGWIVVSPVNPDFAELFQSRREPLARLMDDITGRFHIEGGTFHLAGVSNGGRAAFIELLHEPHRFASLTVLPGLMAHEASGRRVRSLSGVPVSMFVGGDDAHWLAESRRTVRELESAGVDVTLTVREGEGHLVAIPPEELFDLLESRRP